MQDNQFQGLELDHLSPSTVNSFIENKIQFVRNKVLKEPFKGNANMSRGSAIEHAVNEKFNGDKRAPELIAIERYKALQENQGWADKPDVEETIAPIAKVAWPYYQKIADGKRPKMQQKLNFQSKHLQRPIIGFLDYMFPFGIRDCKVVGRTPSKLKQSYVIQGAVYSKVFKMPVTFDFFIPMAREVRAVSIPISEEEVRYGWKYFMKAAKAIESLIETIDPTEVMHIMAFPNLEAIWDEEERKEVAKLYGLQ